MTLDQKEGLCVLVGIILFCVVLFGVVGGFVNWANSYETDADGYSRITSVLEKHPSLKPMIQKALSDGVLTTGEVIEINHKREFLKDRAEFNAAKTKLSKHVYTKKD